MTLQQTGYPDWQCPSCKQWIPSGQLHTCGGCYPQQYYTYQPYIDPAVFERIAKALEAIASQLTKYAPDVASAASAEPDSGLESVPAVESDTQPRG